MWFERMTESEPCAEGLGWGALDFVLEEDMVAQRSAWDTTAAQTETVEAYQILDTRLAGEHRQQPAREQALRCLRSSSDLSSPTSNSGLPVSTASSTTTTACDHQRVCCAGCGEFARAGGQVEGQKCDE